LKLAGIKSADEYFSRDDFEGFFIPESHPLFFAPAGYLSLNIIPCVLAPLQRKPLSNYTYKRNVPGKEKRYLFLSIQHFQNFFV